MKYEKALNVKKALRYFLSPVSLSIATADGSKKGTKKSDLLPITKDKMTNENITTNLYNNKVSAYTLDFMAFLRTLTDIPSTYQDLAWCVIKEIPSGYNQVDIAADTYRPGSIKMQKRDGQGRSNWIILNSVKSRNPCDFKESLSNGENKSKLIALIFEYFVIKKAKILKNLHATKLVLLEEGKTTVITLGRTFISEVLSSDQEKADTQVILNYHDALKENSNGSIIVRSASDKTDILVLAVVYLYNEKQRAYIDSGRRTSRKVYWMKDIVLPEDEVNSLMPLHVLTGNEYFSSFS